MWTIAVFCFFFALCSYSSGNPTGLASIKTIPPEIEEDSRLNFIDLAGKYGYPAETHEVQTEDGYFLTLHRITGSPKYDPNLPKKGIVLVQHGLLCSSIDWIIMGPEKALGYVLADSGYDVWFGNQRGNTFSRKHLYLDPKSDEFWAFSWHEIGKYDIPAYIDYILHVTNEASLYYIGHSQGTTEFFVFGAERPEHAHKVKTMFALAPIGYMKHLKSPFVQIAAKIQKILMAGADLLGINEFLPQSQFVTDIGEQICSDQHPEAAALCSNVIFLLCGFDSEELNTTMLPVILGHNPAGASIRQLFHYAQEVTSAKFRQYDFGEKGNLENYGTVDPPEYDLSNIHIPISLHYARNDWMAAIEDVEALADEMPNVILRDLVGPEKFNHLDFMWAIDANTYLYQNIIQMMDKDSQKN